MEEEERGPLEKEVNNANSFFFSGLKLPFTTAVKAPPYPTCCSGRKRRLLFENISLEEEYPQNHFPCQPSIYPRNKPPIPIVDLSCTPPGDI